MNTHSCALSTEKSGIPKEGDGDESSKGNDKMHSAGATCIPMALEFKYVHEEDN